MAYQKLFLLFLSRLIVETTGLDNLVVDVELIPSTSEHGFFDTLLGDESQDTHNLRLTDTVSTILGLQIGVWIPIRVEAAMRDQLVRAV